MGPLTPVWPRDFPRRSPDRSLQSTHIPFAASCRQPPDGLHQPLRRQPLGSGDARSATSRQLPVRASPWSASSPVHPAESRSFSYGPQFLLLPAFHPSSRRRSWCRIRGRNAFAPMGTSTPLVMCALGRTDRRRLAGCLGDAAGNVAASAAVILPERIRGGALASTGNKQGRSGVPDPSVTGKQHNCQR